MSARRLGALLGALVVGLCAAGCGGPTTDLDHMALSSAIAVDVAPHGGVRLTIDGLQPGSQAMSTSSSGSGFGGGSGGGSLQPFALDATGPTLVHALAKASHQSNGRLYLGSTRVIVFSEALLRRGVRKVATDLLQVVEVPDYTPVLGSTAGVQARDLVTGPVSQRAAGDSYLYRLAMYTSETAAHGKPPTLQEVVTESYEPSDVLSVPLFDDVPPGVHQVAIMAGDRLVAALPEEDAMVVRAQRHPSGPAWQPLTIEYGGQAHEVVARVLQIAARTSIDPQARLATVDISGHTYLAGDVPDVKIGSMEPGLEEAFNAALARQTLAVCERMYARHVDILRLAEKLPGMTPDRPPPPEWQDILRQGLRIEVRSHVQVVPGEASV